MSLKWACPRIRQKGLQYFPLHSTEAMVSLAKQMRAFLLHTCQSGSNRKEQHTLWTSLSSSVEQPASFAHDSYCRRQHLHYRRRARPHG